MKNHMWPAAVMALLAWAGGCRDNPQPPIPPPPGPMEPDPMQPDPMQPDPMQPDPMQPGPILPGPNQGSALPTTEQSQPFGTIDGSESSALGVESHDTTDRYSNQELSSSASQGFGAAAGDAPSGLGSTEAPVETPLPNPFPAENASDISLSDRLDAEDETNEDGSTRASDGE